MRLVSLLVSALLLGLQFIPGRSEPGTVSGRVKLKGIPPQQVASRYPAPGGPLQQSINPIPAVVFIEGPVAGAPAWPKPSKAAMVQKNFQFSPSLLVVPRDTSVSFPNEDGEFHNVFSYSKPKRFDLGRYPKGESKIVVFDKPGIVKIYCEIHPWMRAAVLVLENPLYGVVAADGTFSITGIPAGHYEMAVWNIDAGSDKFEVDVAAGKISEVGIQLSGKSEPPIKAQNLRSDVATVMTHDPAKPFPERACCVGKR